MVTVSEVGVSDPQPVKQRLIPASQAGQDDRPQLWHDPVQLIGGLDAPIIFKFIRVACGTYWPHIQVVHGIVTGLFKTNSLFGQAVGSVITWDAHVARDPGKDDLLLL